MLQDARNNLVLASISVEGSRAFLTIFGILMCVWASLDDQCWLGKPNWRGNSISWHALLMSAALFSAIVAITSHWIRYNANDHHPYDMYFLRVYHYGWRLCALIAASIGIQAVRDNNIHVSEATNKSMHAWFGYIAFGCLCYFALIDCCRLVLAALRSVNAEPPLVFTVTLDDSIIHFWKCWHHSTFSHLFLFSLLLATVTGIQHILDLCHQQGQGGMIGNFIGLCALLSLITLSLAVSFRRSAAIYFKIHGSGAENGFGYPQVTRSDIDGLIGIEPELYSNLYGEREGEARHRSLQA